MEVVHAGTVRILDILEEKGHVSWMSLSYCVRSLGGLTSFGRWTASAVKVTFD